MNRTDRRLKLALEAYIQAAKNLEMTRDEAELDIKILAAAALRKAFISIQDGEK